MPRPLRSLSYPGDRCEKRWETNERSELPWHNGTREGFPGGYENKKILPQVGEET